MFRKGGLELGSRCLPWCVSSTPARNASGEPGVVLFVGVEQGRAREHLPVRRDVAAHAELEPATPLANRTNSPPQWTFWYILAEKVDGSVSNGSPWNDGTPRSAVRLSSKIIAFEPRGTGGGDLVQ